MRIETINSILILVNLMLEPRGSTMAEMKAVLPCSERSLHRLIAVMQELNIPIHQTWEYAGNTNSKRWKIIESEWSSPSPLYQNLRTILLLKLLLEQIEKKYPESHISAIHGINEKIKKNYHLRNLTQNQHAFIKTNYTTFKGYKDYTEKEPLIESLLENIREQKSITVTYHSPKNSEPKQYKIHPYTIVSHDNGLYLLAAIPKHNENIIVLAIERIVSVDCEHHEKFTIPDSYDPDVFFRSSFGITIGEPLNVKIRFDKEAAFYANERIWGENQFITNFEDESIVLSFTASGLKEISRWILSFGKHAQVLEPGELVEELRKETRGIEQIYS